MTNFIKGGKMENNKIRAELEKYAPWIKINRIVAEHVFIISIIYILAYIAITFYLWGLGFQMTNVQQTVYLIGFGLLIIAIFLALKGFMLRSVK